MINLYVYKIKNKINDKIYIGITDNPERRFQEHCNRNESVVSKAIHKYGKENFSMEILEEGLSIEESYIKEKFYIKTLNSQVPNGYNVASGGQWLASGEHNGRAKLTEKEVKYIKDNRDKPLPVLYRKFKDKIGKRAFEEIYYDHKWKYIKSEIDIYPHNFEFSCQFINSKLSYEEIVELRKEYAKGTYWRELYEKYKDSYKNEYSFWQMYNGYTYRLIMPEVFTRENKLKQRNYKRPVGEKNGRAKLTELDVVNIRKMWKETHNRKNIYEAYPHVTPTSIRDIINYKTWKNIP